MNRSFRCGVNATKLRPMWAPALVCISMSRLKGQGSPSWSDAKTLIAGFYFKVFHKSGTSHVGANSNLQPFGKQLHGSRFLLIAAVVCREHKIPVNERFSEPSPLASDCCGLLPRVPGIFPGMFSTPEPPFCADTAMLVEQT